MQKCCTAATRSQVTAHVGAVAVRSPSRLNSVLTTRNAASARADLQVDRCVSEVVGLHIQYSCCPTSLHHTDITWQHFIYSFPFS